jgi:Kdo2-lipid IVA lauroyltransferase/acyltransferase
MRIVFIELLAQFIIRFGNDINSKWCKICAYFFEYVLKYRSRIINENVNKIFPNFDENEKSKVIKKYYRQLSVYILESIFAYFGPEAKVLDKVVMQENVQLCEAYADNKKIIILSGHYGNWELISMALPHMLKMNIYGVYKKLSSPFFEKLILSKRSRFGLNLVEMKEVITLFNKMKGEAFITLLIADQSPAVGEEGKVVSFLGQQTMFYQGAALLQKRYNAKVFYQKVDIKNGIYYVSFIEIYSNVIEEFAQALEKDIYHKPELWLWSHNRWKHRLESN